MSDCDFTEPQRQVIRQARADKKALQKNAIAPPKNASGTQKPVKVSPPAIAVAPKIQKSKSLSKLGKILYLQSGLCFFCGEHLKEEDSSIEHLNPKSRGGSGTEDNLVVCHKSLNETFGAMDVKRKFAFVLKSTGAFKCPEK